MTKTGMENRKLAQEKSIKKAERDQARELSYLDRKAKIDIAHDTNKTNLKSNLWGNAIKSVGTVGAGLLKAYNDPEWYKAYISDLQNFVNVPTYDRLGSGRYRGLLTSIPQDNVTQDLAGIMIFEWVPTVGNQTSGQTTYFRNPVNQTLTRSKEKVLALNSRSSTTWEPSDLGYNVFCSADIMTQILELGRVIAVYGTYRSKNAYLAKTLIQALGYSFADIEANFAEYRKTYQILARKFNSAIVAPSGMSLYKRRAFLASNVFVDTQASDVRQMYAYSETKYFILADTAETCTLLDVNRSSLANIKASIELMFSRITDNPDYIEMYQDLRHAFGQDIVQIDTDIVNKEIIFNSVALNRAQIHNLRINPLYMKDNTSIEHAAITNTDWFLRQDSEGYLYQGSSNGSDDRCTVMTGTGNFTVYKSFLDQYLDHISGMELYNSYSESVSGDEILDITRFGFTAKISTITSGVSLRIVSCGTEFIYKSAIWFHYDDGQGLDAMSKPFSTYMCLTTVFGEMAFHDFENYVLSSYSNFDWAPIVHEFLNDEDQDVWKRTFVEAYTSFVIRASNLEDISSACVMGELYVPDSGFKGFSR